LLAVLAAGVLDVLEALLVAFFALVLFAFVAFLEVVVVFGPAGEVAANVRGMVATASAIAANNVFFISFSPCGRSARSHFHLPTGSVFTR
jgi:hypothetical protein